MKLNRQNPFLAAVITLTLAAPAAFAASGDWISNTSDNWSVATKWSSNPTVPGTAAGDVIGLNNDISANRTITIDTTSRTAGTLNIGDSNNTHGFTLAASGGAILTLDNSGAGAQINMTGGLATTISAPVTLADNLAVNSAGYLLVSGGITESALGKTLTKTGLGTLSLAGTSSYTGGSTVTAGALSFRTTASVALTGTHAFGANATLGLGVGAGGFLMTDVNNALGGTAPAIGTITLDAATKIGVDTGAGNFDFNTALATSSRGLVKLGGSTLTLSTDNSAFSGNITVDAGTLAITNNNALGNTTGKTIINGSNASSGSALSFAGVASDLTIAEDINFAGNPTGRSLLSHASNFNHTFTGAINISSDTNIAQWGSGGDAVTGSVKFTGNITGTFTNGAGLLIRGNAPLTPLVNPINKIESNITLTGGGLTKTDTGTWRIGAAGKTYSAPTLGVSIGILQMGGADYLTAAAPVLTMGNTTGTSAGSLDLNGYSQTVGGIIYAGAGSATGTRPITNSDAVNAAVLTVDNATDFTANGSGANSVVLTGNLGLTKKGAGQLRLDGTHTFTGATIVSGGNLTIAN